MQGLRNIFNPMASQFLRQNSDYLQQNSELASSVMERLMTIQQSLSGPTESGGGDANNNEPVCRPVLDQLLPNN